MGLFIRCWLLTALTITAAAAPLKIRRITPEGTDVPPGSQIVIHFNRAVVPLGRMERKNSEIPITISPKLDCQWRWIDTSTLGCQLDENEEFQNATRYKMVINPGIKAEDGSTLKKKVDHEFIVQRPTVRYVGFNTWKGPGMPYMQITFNQPVSKKSVEKFLHFQVKRKGLKGALKFGPNKVPPS